MLHVDTEVTVRNLTLYTLTSACKFSTLFSIHFLRCWQGEFVLQSRASSVVDQFLYSLDLTEWFRGGHCEGKLKLMPVPLRDLRIINNFVVFKWVLLGFPKLILQFSSMLYRKIVEFLILIAEINLGHFKANFSCENLM